MSERICFKAKYLETSNKKFDNFLKLINEQYIQIRFILEAEAIRDQSSHVVFISDNSLCSAALRTKNCQRCFIETI